MAVTAGHATVSPGQWKRCLRMVKLSKLFPSFGRVARFAACKCAIRTLHFHSFAKLPLVRIDVARGA